MKGSAIRPRPDQITELTRGLRLPLPEIAKVHLEIIAEGLLRAFNDIRTQKPATVASGNEPEVTALMEARLNRLIEQDPFWGNLVLCVARGKESLNYNGSRIDKRPDLSIYLSDQTRGFPLITEAKLLDAATSKTVALYCDQGLRRFVDGEYAWANREAFMIAYVRDGSSIDSKLRPFLSNAMARDPARYLVKELPTPVRSGSSDLACSRHDRYFVYSMQSRPSNKARSDLSLAFVALLRGAWRDAWGLEKEGLQRSRPNPVPRIGGHAHVKVEPKPGAAPRTSSIRPVFSNSRGSAAVSSNGHSWVRKAQASSGSPTAAATSAKPATTRPGPRICAAGMFSPRFVDLQARRVPLSTQS